MINFVRYLSGILLLSASGFAFSVCNPLSMPVRMTPPMETLTVFQAVMYVLQPSGYRLVTGQASPTASEVLLQPVPPDAFNGKVLPVSSALLLLIGEHNRLIIDPEHRLVSFEKINRGSR